MPAIVWPFKPTVLLILCQERDQCVVGLASELQAVDVGVSGVTFYSNAEQILCTATFNSKRKAGQRCQKYIHLYAELISQSLFFGIGWILPLLPLPNFRLKHCFSESSKCTRLRHFIFTCLQLFLSVQFVKTTQQHRSSWDQQTMSEMPARFKRALQSIL